MVHEPRFKDYPNKIVHEIGKTVRVPDFENYFGGKIGGKGEGLKFFRHALLDNEEGLRNDFGGRVFFACPKTSVLETNLFQKFMEANGLWKFIGGGPENGELLARFLQAEFTGEQRQSFAFIINDREKGHVRPMVVRSSGLNEDAERASFAGIYKSVPLPNCHPDAETRLRQFEAAVKLVYASMFSESARAYRNDRKIPEGGEEMAVLVQNMAGRLWQTGSGLDIYHPELSFAAFSFNDFPVAGAKQEDGFARIAFGLGQGVVDVVAKTAIRVNLGKPNPPAGMYDTKQALRCAPDSFYALPFSSTGELPNGENFYLHKFELREHGSQGVVERHYGWFDGIDAIWDYPRGERPSPVATFSGLLKNQYGNSVVKVIRRINEILKSYFGTDVDFEGAIDIIKGNDGKCHTVFYILQARSQVRSDMGRVEELPRAGDGNVLLSATGAVGRGGHAFRHIIYVPPESFDFQSSVQIAGELRTLNARLGGEGQYLLLVPGRFGSSDPSLGVPADFGTASNAVGVVEYMKGGWEPSQGTHMFESMVGSGKALLHYGDGELRLDNIGRLGAKMQGGAHCVLYEFAKPVMLDIDMQGNCLVYSP